MILFETILSLRGKMTFRNMSRYSDLHEKTYSRQFSKEFDFTRLNRELIDQVVPNTSDRIVAFDCVFIKKSGHKSYGIDRFFNGTSARVERGQELSVASIVDLTHHTAYTLSLKQTPVLSDCDPSEKEQTRMDFYVQHLQSLKDTLNKKEQYVVADGYFAKEKFIKAVRAINAHLITKLRCDANMRYLYEGQQKARGRRKVFDGKVDWKNLSRFEYLGETDHYKIYTQILNHPHFKCNLKVIVVVDGKTQKHRIYASTDLKLKASTCLEYAKDRFQIEFLFRDAKQFTGLQDCQTTDKDKLNFHFNAALTTLNVAKIEHFQNVDDPNLPCSIGNIKRRFFNERFLKTISLNLNLDLNELKMHENYQKLRNYGKIAA